MKKRFIKEIVSKATCRHSRESVNPATILDSPVKPENDKRVFTNALISITLLLLIALCPVFIAEASAWTEQEKLIIGKANWFFNTSPKEKPRSIANTGLQERIENEGDKLFLLDVRNALDYKEKRIKVQKGITVVNIPQKDLFEDEKLKSIPRDKDIVLICYTGGISSQMVPLLYMLGYRAIALSGGIEEWDVQGLPLEK